MMANIDPGLVGPEWDYADGILERVKALIEETGGTWEDAVLNVMAHEYRNMHLLQIVTHPKTATKDDDPIRLIKDQMDNGE